MAPKKNPKGPTKKTNAPSSEETGNQLPTAQQSTSTTATAPGPSTIDTPPSSTIAEDIDTGATSTSPSSVIADSNENHTTIPDPIPASEQPPNSPVTPTRFPRPDAEIVLSTRGQVDTPPIKKKSDSHLNDFRRSKIVDKFRIGTAILCVAALDPIWPVTKQKKRPLSSPSPIVND
jgi:hypothetical protein